MSIKLYNNKNDGIVSTINPIGSKVGTDPGTEPISTLAFQFPRVSPPGQPLETNKNQETRKLGNPCPILWIHL